MSDARGVQAGSLFTTQPTLYSIRKTREAFHVVRTHRQTLPYLILRRRHHRPVRTLTARSQCGWRVAPA